MTEAPLPSPLVIASRNMSLRNVTSIRQQLWANFEILGADNYLALASGWFVHEGFNAAKGKPTQVYRTGDPASCGSTTSTLPVDVPIKAGIASSCAQSSYVDVNGNPTNSFNNFVFDSRAQPWYTRAETSRVSGFSLPFLSVISGRFVVSYSSPMYNSNGSLTGVYGVDLSLDKIEASVNVIQSANAVSYITVASTNQLLSTSVGESKYVSVGGAIATKSAVNASNFIIRDSARYILNNKITSEGFYSYTGSDGNSYALQLKFFTDQSTQSVKWNIVVVSLVSSTSSILATSALVNTLKSVSQDLTMYLNDSISATGYLSFYAGAGYRCPLTNKLFSGDSISFVGLLQQTIWGVVSTIFGNTNVSC